MMLGRLAGRARPPETPAGPPPLVHRPPGAVDEEAFLAGCTRCGDCITACPVDAIVLAGERYGRAAGTPVIDPMTSPCVMCDGTPCIPACEPGVLTADASLAMGTASIRVPNCLAHQGTFCTVCSERCPVEGALEVVAGKPVVHEQTCTGCGVCQHVCPAPYNAVLILPRQRGRSTAPPPADGGFDWRQAYFGDRSLAPPDDRPS